MPTGPSHKRIFHNSEGEKTAYSPCRCMIGVDHEDWETVVEDDEEGEGEALDVHDAADIWMSSGGDEDYTWASPLGRTPVYAACWLCQNSSNSLGDM